jgi:hypothetical protein
MNGVGESEGVGARSAVRGGRTFVRIVDGPRGADARGGG